MCLRKEQCGSGKARDMPNKPLISAEIGKRENCKDGKEHLAKNDHWQNGAAASTEKRRSHRGTAFAPMKKH